MLIRLDVFAEMLNIRPSDLQHAASSDGELDGLALPGYRQIRGAMMMFDQTEATEFAELWHTRFPGLLQARLPTPVAPGTPPVSLREFAMLCDLPPLELFQAIKRGRTLRGIPLPEVLGTGNELQFTPESVRIFLHHFHHRQQD